jgi:hypothetical protein
MGKQRKKELNYTNLNCTRMTVLGVRGQRVHAVLGCVLARRLTLTTTAVGPSHKTSGNPRKRSPAELTQG